MVSHDVFDAMPFTVAMARDRGITRNRLRSLLANGEIRTVFHQVYVARGTPDSVYVRARAAALVVPEHAVVCDRCAAWLHGIDLLDFAELDLPPALDVVSVGGNQGTHRAGTFGGKRDLRPEEITVIDGIRVTTPLRTACDIACLKGRLRALAALDAFRRAFDITPAQFAEMLPRYSRRRGVLQLRELVPLSTDQAESQPESWVRLMILDEGLPGPSPQLSVLVPGWGRVRMENAYEHLRIAVEYDGAEFHTATPDREHDELRRAALRRLGWSILVLRKEDLSAAARVRWLRELAAAIAERVPESPTKRTYARGPDWSSYRGRP